MKTIKSIKIGETAKFTKMISESDVQIFAEISGDHNPLHLNAEYASGTLFKERVAHGMLSGSLISAVIGNQLPGLGTIYLKQELKFVKPVKLNEEVTAQVTVIEKSEDRNRVVLETTCYNSIGEVVISGMALVMPPKGD